MHAFSGESSMTFLNFGGNNLKYVPALPTLVNLQSLTLEANKITNATFPEEYRNNPSLGSVVLSNNNIQFLDNYTFQYLGQSNLRKLELTRNKINQISNGAFSPLRKIQSLKLGHNPLKADALAVGLAGLEDAPLVSLNIANLTLGGSLPSTTFQLLQETQLNTLVMSNNKIDKIPPNGFSYLKTLATLDISKSGIFEISDTAFDGMDSLYNLLLNDNNLERVPQNLPSSLQYLYLNGNKIKTLENNAFGKLTILKKLYLGANSISKLYENAFSSLSNLQILHLQKNLIGTLPGSIFMPLVNLHSLELNKNQLTTIQSSTGSLFESLTSLTYLSLADNDCSHIPITLFNRLQSLMTLRLENNQLGNIIAGDKNGQFFSGLQRLQALHLVNNRISTIPDPLFKDLVSLKVLNLTGNFISGWGPHLFAKTSMLQTLDISKNYVSLVNTTSVKDFRSLAYLNLSGNPFACTCDLRWFRDWINTTTTDITNVEHYRCNSPKEWKGKHLLTFDRRKINCLFFTLPVLLVSVGTGIAVIGLIIFLVYYKRWTLRLCWYRTKRQCCRRRQQNGDYKRLPGENRVYDAYISACDADDRWVLDNLLPDIDCDNRGERPFNGRYRLYFDARDNDPGMWIVENIQKHMRMSRTVVIVLTDNYLSNQRYSYFELQLAIEMRKENEIEKIIVIKVGDVSVHRIPKILYFMMENRKFLEWEDVENAKRAFKERLQDMLAEPITELAEVV